jgi:saccharopine dehydrogenase-like NADP-dependent oxidoreductase
MFHSGGSVMNGILSHNDENMKSANIFAAVRSNDQIDKISKLERVRAVNLDLSDKTAIEREIELNKSEYDFSVLPYVILQPL